VGPFWTSGIDLRVGLSWVYVLNISLMKLKCFPDMIGQLKQLSMFTMQHGPIKYLLKGVLELNNLEILSVQYCLLLAMPFALTGLGSRA
jgi:hypothetical protein